MRPILQYILAGILMISLGADSALALPSFEELQGQYRKSDSLLLDRHGAILHELRTDQKGRRLEWTKLEEISPALKQAVLCSEDKRFFDHAGVDYVALGKAALDFFKGSGRRGASTITMQLASFLDREIAARKKQRSLQQKAKQILLAREMEKSWSKNEILEAYLNLVSFRGEYTGIAAAARGLFGKHPHGLDQAESLILACLIRAPNTNAVILESRVKNLNSRISWKTPDARIHEKIHNLSLGMDRVRPLVALAPHTARLLLKNAPPGTQLHSTLDARLQRFAASQLALHVHDLSGQCVQQGALLVLENHTGDVLAYVSYSADPSAGSYVDGVQALRQTGSTLKPFLYAQALEQRILTAASLLDDSPLDIPITGGIYQPGNYDANFHGPVSVRVALASSLNVPAVRTLMLVGADSFLNTLKQVIPGPLEASGDYYGFSLALGSADISLWDLTNAYRALANGGIWSRARLTHDNQNPSAARRRVYSAETAFIVSDILADRDARSKTFGLENPLAMRFWSAVKTGTSKDMRDNWCIGYSNRYTVGVWVGNFSGQSMWNVSGISGAAPVWNAVMDYLHTQESSFRPKPPGSLVRTPSIEGEKDVEWFIKGTEPEPHSSVSSPEIVRIVYPPSGTIVALDPDIPGHLQKISFVAKTGKERHPRWSLNKRVLPDQGKTILWTPEPGRHVLSVADEHDQMLDTVQFEVK